MELVVSSFRNEINSGGWKRIEPLTINIDDIRNNNEFLLKCKEHFIDHCVCPNCGSILVKSNEDTFECEKCLREYKGLEDLNLDIVILEERCIPESLKGFDYKDPTFWNLFGGCGLSDCGCSLDVIEAFNSIYPIKDVTFTEDWLGILKESFLFESYYTLTFCIDEELGRYCVENDLLPYSVPEEIYDYLDFELLGRDYRFSEGIVYVNGYVFFN